MPPPAEGIAARFVLGPALRTQPDRRLVTLVREGYEVAFEEIVRRYGKPLGRYAAAIVGSRSEDVTQDAFSKALLALQRDDADIELRPWLFRIVRNTALNDLRDSPPSPEVLAEAIAGGASPAEELERREELADLMRRLRALPEPQRAAIVMRELEGLGHEEIAAALGLSGGGARQAIYRARRALRDGAGMLFPLPLLQAMLAGTGSGAAEAAAGAAGIGGAAGAGVAIKATAATVLVAGAVGAGVAIDRSPRESAADATPAPAQRSAAGDFATTHAPSVSTEGDGRQRGEDRGGRHGDGSGRGEEHGDDDGGGPGPSLQTGDDRDHRGSGSGKSGSSGRRGGSGRDDDLSGSSGHGSGRDGGSEADHSGPGPGGGGPGASGGSGSGHGGSGSDDGSGSSGSGSSGSGSSSDGSGRGGPGPSEPASEAISPEPVAESPEDDNSGSGSGDGSGSGGGGGEDGDGSSG